MKVFLVDDEKSCRVTLISFLDEYEIVEEIQQADSVESSMEVLRTFKPDVVFLDVRLGNQTSFEILDQLEEIDFQIIFTTAFDEYAVKAFQYSAVHYILKPLDKKELFDALGRCAAKEFSYSTKDIKKIQGLFLQQENKSYSLSFEDIIALKADGNYCKVYRKDGSSIVMSKNIGEYDKVLPPQFFRAHKSTIVNLMEVSELDVQRNVIVMKTGLQCEFSRRKKAKLREELKKYFTAT